MSFIEPGPISYREMKNGTIELLRKSTIDASCHALVGQPVTMGHPTAARNDAEIKDWARQNAIGTIESVTYNADDGWYWAEGAVTKPEAVRENCAPSVVFFARGYGSAGKFHGIPYGRELTAVEFDHIGLVPNPRFENATARFNSNNQPVITMFKWLRSIVTKQKNAEGVESDVRINEEGEIPAEAKVDLGNGVTISLSELVANHTARENAAAKDVTLEPDTEITVAGKQVKLSDLVAGESAARLNAAAIEQVKADKIKADADAAALKAKEGGEFFVRLNAAKTNAAADPFAGRTPDKTPVTQREAARVNKLFGAPGQKA